MKLKEFIENGDFSGLQKDTENPISDEGTLGACLYYDNQVDYNHIWAVNNSKRFVQYYIRTWFDSYENVGLFLNTLDDEPVMISYKSYAKGDHRWEFLSEECHKKVRKAFDDCRPDIELGEATIISKFNFLKMGGEGQITRKDLGLSPIATSDMTYKIEKYMAIDPLMKAPNDDSDENLSKIISKNIQEHYVFMKTLNGDDLVRAEEESKNNITKWEEIQAKFEAWRIERKFMENNNVK